MQPLAVAIYEIMTALLVRQSAVPPTSQGYSKYNFQCWLCSGQTTFSCPKPTKELFFDVECCRCGMANKVKVAPQISK